MWDNSEIFGSLGQRAATRPAYVPEAPAQPATPAPALAPMPETPLFIQRQAGNAPANAPASDELSLSAIENEYLTVIWMLLGGVAEDVIETCLGKSPGYIVTARTQPVFRVLYRKCVEIKAKSEAGHASDPDALYNAQIAQSAATIIQIRDNIFAKDNARLKAAEHFTDRASKAPKVRREIEQRQTILALPVSALAAMQQALIEEGSPKDLEIVDLLKGDGYTVDGEDVRENAKSGNEDNQTQIPVERVD